MAKSTGTREIDRIRRRAVSLYLSDRRETLVKLVPGKYKRDRNVKRKELERLAREKFGCEEERIQAEYLKKVHRGQPDASVPMPLKDQSGVESSGVLASGVESGVESSGVLASGVESSGVLASGVESSGVLASLGQHWTTGCSNELHDGLVRQVQPLRSLYGDAGALETLAAGIRILSVVDLERWPDRMAVKMAVVTGMAAKLTQTCDDKHVLKLWSNIAGKSAAPLVRSLERQVFVVWARNGLESECEAMGRSRLRGSSSGVPA